METEEINFENFVELHINQLTNSGVPQLYWQTLFVKLKEEVYDAGNAFEMQQVLHTQDEENSAEEADSHWRIICILQDGIKRDDAQHIYLIDHAWTFKSSDARAALEEIPSLVSRMVDLMNIESEGKSQQELIEDVLETMWLYNQTYRFGNFAMGSDESMPMWYIMDEFGSRIRHSDNPNFRVIPFFYAASGMAYSIMWPIKELEMAGEEA